MSETAAQRTVRVRVEPVPRWLDTERLLGPGFVLTPRAQGGLTAEGTLGVREAALLASRLRGLGLDGEPLMVTVTPPLARSLVRRARLDDARARRSITPGFVRAGARASGAGRFSLTPEVLALELGRLAAGRSVVDACCGSGGNTVGFARAGAHVTAIELDPERLMEARHNVALYQVAPRVRFLQGDVLALLSAQKADILFVDPPWGESYDKRRTTRGDFPLLDQLLSSPLAGFGELWMKLPASFATASVPGATARAWFGQAEGDRQRIKFVQLCLPLRGQSAG